MSKEGEGYPGDIVWGFLGTDKKRGDLTPANI